MKKERRSAYLLVSIIVVIAALVFLRTLIAAAFYVPDSGSSGSIYIVSSDDQRPRPIYAGAADMTGTSTDSTSTDAVGTTTATTALVASTAPRASAEKWIPAKSTSMPADYPVHLAIPSLKISAAVQYLGVNSKGALGVPNNFTDVGWYAAGTIPGDRGSAVIDGHVDNGLALAGVFKHLASIAVGDDILVTDHDGTIVHFAVTGIQSFDYKNAPVDMIFNERDGSFLKLVTCGGTWVPGDRTYDQRLVVTAVLVP